ncbi:hypothetical protein NAEGRDRAFT_59573 [Naegleria gruberi]|uniref:DUF1343 domain-containing protein n=1 Tax=Naegleria gruberi TaxID=5762 RepID=D2VY90_NAEGR|nr:uncharacterized protein NAEGRDRAFT_59573 [Naegleria gruberi]EFC38158.1 hypothetical protein NAEGRDRAFT_59573 [Naegleria gruberi]|eukprot:XP_002670902.1 hypothetical protein NAEGRDRAFT_59573 [Naegleria gruberi strain NEG-M]
MASGVEQNRNVRKYHNNIKAGSTSSYVQPGINNSLQPLFGHNIGLITNPSGQNYQLSQSTIDLLMELTKQGYLNLVALFAPEHGIYGDKPPGQFFNDYIDPYTKLPVYSLYSETNPTHEPLPYMLKNVTMLVSDIQDVGMRPFTFISTMCEGLIGAKKNSIKFTVLDRINYLNGNIIAGPILNMKYKSFIGIYKLPIVTGMTMGELALLFDKEMYINLDNDLTIIPIVDDSSQTYGKYRPSFREIRQVFRQPILYLPPSPNLPTIESVELYSGMVLFESLFNISIGRGTTNPFQVIGSPFIDSRKWMSFLQQEFATELSLYFKYVQLSYPTYFIPSLDIHQNAPCEGIRLVLKPLDYNNITNIEEYYRSFLPLSLTLMKSLLKLYGKELLIWRTDFAHILIGSEETISQILDNSVTVGEIVNSWNKDLVKFDKNVRQKYLIYK